MKLVTFEQDGTARIGVLRDQEVIDLQATDPHLPTEMLAFLDAGREATDRARAAHATDGAQTFPLTDVRLLAPIRNPRKFIAIGQNYADHCAEQNVNPPKTPILFAKFATAIIGPGAPIRLSEISEKVDYEAELAFVIGRHGRDIPEDQARAHIAGYTICNDVSARDLQFADRQWVRGKSIDTFAPLGPALVTPDEIDDPHTLDISLTLNGKTMQSSNTRNLLFGVDTLVSFLSRAFTLEPGDVVTTGTPPGVGVFRTPPVFLQCGDTVSITIESVGVLTNPVA